MLLLRQVFLEPFQHSTSLFYLSLRVSLAVGSQVPAANQRGWEFMQTGAVMISNNQPDMRTKSKPKDGEETKYHATNSLASVTTPYISI